jgi:hypothetical protein
VSRLLAAVAVAAVAVAVVVIVLARNGSDHRDSSRAGATERLVTSCTEGREADRRLCECIADELVAHHGLKTSAQLDRARREVEAGRRPAAVVAAAAACRARA